MRCIAKYRTYGVQIRPHITEAFATGAVVTKQEQVIAMFEPYKLTHDERELALASFGFNGFMQEMDEATVVPPDYRLSVFDSRQAQMDHGWSDEFRQEVERELLRVNDQTADFIIAPEIHFNPPWPRYNDYDGPPSALVRKLVDEGYDLAEVLAYEVSDDGLGREKVIAALSDAISEGVEEEEVIAG